MFVINFSSISSNCYENVMIFTESIDWFAKSVWHSNFKTWTRFFKKMKRIEKPHEFISFWTLMFLIFDSAVVLCNYTTMINSDHIYLLCEIPFLWPLMWQSLCHIHTHASRKIYYWKFNENLPFFLCHLKTKRISRNKNSFFLHSIS